MELSLGQHHEDLAGCACFSPRKGDAYSLSTCWIQRQVKRALGSLGAFKCSHPQDPTAPPLSFILERECGTGRRSTAVLLWDRPCRDDQCSFLG